MTQPNVLPGLGDDAGADNQAIDTISRLTAGNQNLITHPHLISALANANATPQQAQAINQFVGGLKATGAIQAARIAGSKITLSATDKALLDGVGTNYSDVEYTQADKQAAADAITQQMSLAADEKAAAPKGSMWGLSQIWHGLTHNPVTNEIGNLPNQVAGAGNWSRVAIESLTGGPSDADKAAAKAQGYNLDDPMQALSYEMSGKRPINAGNIYSGGASKEDVDAALQFVDDPKGFLDKVVNDPNLTPDEATALQDKYLKSKEFQDLVTRVRAQMPSPGNLLTYGVDPVAHPTIHNDVSAATDAVYFFLADPTQAVVSGVFRAAKISAIGLDSIGDTDKIYAVVGGAQKGSNAARVRNGVQSLINNTGAIRAAEQSGDKAAEAAAYARIRNETPGLEHLTTDFLGRSKAVGFDEAAKTGLRLEDGAPITDLKEAAKYLSSKVGAIRLMSGAAPLEGRLMPGQLSAFGVRKLKGSIAATSAARSVKESDRVFNLNKGNLADRVLPKAGVDQVDGTTGKVITETVAEKDAADLASRERGQAQFEARTATLTGNRAVDTVLGWASPGAAINRGRLALTRMFTYLPRDTTFETDDPDSVKKVFQYAKMWLSGGDANLIAARYAAADEGGRKAILQGMQLQTLHAAGLGTSEGGRKIIDDAATALKGQSYSTVKGLDRIIDPETGEETAYAVHLNQVNPGITLKNFKEIHMNAAKIGLWESTVGRMFQSQIADNMMTVVKRGWTMTFTNVYRNAAIDELLHAAIRNEFGDVARAKAVAIQGGLLPERTAVTKALVWPLLKVGQMYRHYAIDTADPRLGLKYLAELDPEFAQMLAQRWTRAHALSNVDPTGAFEATQIVQAGYLPTEMKIRTGFGAVDVTNDQEGADRLAYALGVAFNGNPLHTKALLDHVQAAAAPEDLETTPGRFVDTRGGGAQYHGAPKPVDGDLREGYYNNANIYGGSDTFYTSDAADIAAGYGRKSLNAHVYKVTEKTPVKFFDMESKTSPGDVEKILGVSNDTGDLANFAKQAIEDATDADGVVSLRNAMDEIRRSSKAEGYSRDEVQELLDSASRNLQKMGYGGMRHIGGKLTGNAAHEVKIYLRPHEQIKLDPHEPEREPGTVINRSAADISHVVDSLKAPENAKRVSQMRLANVFTDPTGVTREAMTLPEKEMALTELAQRQVDDARYLLQGREGGLNHDLIEHIREKGAGPDTQWVMDNMTGANRPLTVNAPMYEARPAQKGLLGFVAGLNDTTGKFYQWTVERPIARMSTMPIFLSNYGKARYFLAPAEDEMRAGGLTDEAIDHILSNQGMHMAFMHTSKQIDDPTLRTQMDYVGRNFFAFSRATTAFVRRWSMSFVEDPGRLRKLMLANEAAHRTGLVWKDQNGNDQFTFPASGVAIEAFQHLASAVPGLNMVSVGGMTPNLTGKLMLLQSGLQNPLQVGLTPMVNWPYRSIETLFPQHREGLDEVDAFFNGQQGQGASLWNEIMPTAVKKFSDALTGDDRDGLMADSARAAILNLAADGRLPAGADSDPAVMDAYLKRVQIQMKNNLVGRAIAGFFTPAPPGLPTDETKGSKEDWFYGAIGVRGLDAEYKTILNNFHGDFGRANQLWASLHPDKLFYEVPTSTSTVKSATVAATQAAMNWVQDNSKFMSQYQGVSAYFIPANVQTGDFNGAAYQAEFELGLRQHKSLSDFYVDVRTANASQQYYAATAVRDATIAADPKNKAAYNQQFSDWKNDTFMPMNPLWAQQQSDYATVSQTALGQLKTLRNLADAKNLPPSVPVAVVQDMIASYDTYHKVMSEYPGSTNVAQAIHASVSAQYNDHMQLLVSNNPQLQGLYQGVFRSIDGKVLDKAGSV